MLYGKLAVGKILGIFLLATAQYSTSPSGSIRGVVIGVDGKTIANAEVYAIPADAMDKKPFRTSADALGRFSFAGLSNNGYYLDAAKEKEGYFYSPFSFFIMPGQDKPKVEIKGGKSVADVVVKLGTKAAYLDLQVVRDDGKQGPVELTFTRPDLPGYYKRSFGTEEVVPVPAVPFLLKATGEGQKQWAFHDAKNSDLIKPQPGEHIKLNIILSGSK